MSKMTLTEFIPAVQFVTAPNGQRLAVLDADEWEAFIEWLEDIEDRQIIQNALARLRVGPEKSGALPLEQVLDEL
jgi:hypothetical protein